MSVGAGMLGREIALTVAGQPIAGVLSKGISIANEPVDVSSDDSGAFRELMAQAGKETIDISLSGVTKNMELERSIITNESKIYALVITYSDGSVLTLDGFVGSYSTTGETATAQTFDASFSSSGTYTFTPGA